MNQLKTAQKNRLAQQIEAIENAGEILAMPPKPVQPKKSAAKTGMNSRSLKRHLKYIVPEMRLALIKEPGVKLQAITMADDLEKFVEPLKHYAEEHFVSFHLDTKFHVIGYQIVSRGTISASLVHPREVFKAALLANSYAIIVAVTLRIKWRDFANYLAGLER